MDNQELEAIANINNKIETLTTAINTGFENISTRLVKVEDQLNALDKRLIVVEANTKAMGKQLDNVEKRLTTVEGKLPDISEKFGELKNWRQISFVILAAIAGWAAKSNNF